jgi:hypothetical protein
MVGFPEKTDRGIERLGEFIARHRPFRQAGQDGVRKGHGSDLSRVGMLGD